MEDPARILGSYEALLDDPEIDVVYIALPNSLHVEWTIRALEAGKHVLCEKPLTLAVADVDRVAAAVERTGRTATEGFMYRHQPLTHAVEAIVKSGRLGTIRSFKGAFTFPLTREADVRLDPALGGGSLWDIGCYPVSYSACSPARRRPKCSAGNRCRRRRSTSSSPGMLRFRDGSVAQFDCGFTGPFRAEMEIIGRDASLRVEAAVQDRRPEPAHPADRG